MSKTWVVVVSGVVVTMPSSDLDNMQGLAVMMGGDVYSSYFAENLPVELWL